MSAFEKLKLSKQLLEAINRLGFTEPTQIQRDAIPLILTGKDVIGESATGSGKTLAFGAGVIEKCEPRKRIQAIVLVPTRELAEQVKEEMIKLSFKKQIKILAVYGGVSINNQIEQLRKTDVVIATPGRLLDHVNRKTINTSKVKMLVLDEADRMVEMGFIQDVEKIVKACPERRQTLLFSATMYGPAKKIAKKYMKNPETVHATKMVDPAKLKQNYYKVSSKVKKELLVHLLKKDKSDLVMVFCNTRRATDMIVKILKGASLKAAPIHGGLPQAKRLKTIDLFHKGKFQILVCTDVAARGIHIEGVTHIYNFDIPRDAADYVHRIGRTARAGKKGFVINIVSDRDKNNFTTIKATHGDYNIEKEERPHLEITIKTKTETRRPINSKSKRNFWKKSDGKKKPKKSEEFRGKKEETRGKKKSFRKTKLQFGRNSKRKQRGKTSNGRI